MPPIVVSRPLLFGLMAVGAIVAVATEPPTSSFGAGFAAGVGSAFVVSFMKRGRDEGAGQPPDPADPKESPR